MIRIRAQFRRQVLMWLLLGLALVALVGCSRLFGSEEQSDVELFRRGASQFEKKKYGKAKKSFDRVLDRFVGSELRPDSLLYLAESQYLDGSYDEAQFNFERFQELYPAHKNVELVRFRLAQVDMARTQSIDRDQTFARQAVQKFEAYLATYPEGLFPQQAREYVTYLKNGLAEHEFYVANFYYKKNVFSSAASRFEGILKDYPGSPRHEEALFQLGICYKRLGNFALAQAAWNRLLQDHPRGEFAERAGSALRKLEESQKPSG